MALPLKNCLTKQFAALNIRTHLRTHTLHIIQLIERTLQKCLTCKESFTDHLLLKNVQAKLDTKKDDSAPYLNFNMKGYDSLTNLYSKSYLVISV